MLDDDDQALPDVERTQAELRRNIEESAKLIGQAQDAIRRYREVDRGQDEPA